MVTSWKRMTLIAGVALVFFPVAILAQAGNRYKWKTPSAGGGKEKRTEKRVGQKIICR